MVRIANSLDDSLFTMTLTFNEKIKILYHEYSMQYDIFISLWKETKRLTNKVGLLLFLLAVTVTVAPGSISISGISWILDKSGLIIFRLIIVIALIGVFIETSARITFLSSRYLYILKLESILSKSIPQLNREKSYRQIWNPFYARFLGKHSWRPLILDLIVIVGITTCGIISILKEEILSGVIQLIGSFIIILILFRILLIEYRLNRKREKQWM